MHTKYGCQFIDCVVDCSYYFVSVSLVSFRKFYVSLMIFFCFAIVNLYGQLVHVLGWSFFFSIITMMTLIVQDFHCGFCYGCVALVVFEVQ